MFGITKENCMQHSRPNDWFESDLFFSVDRIFNSVIHSVSWEYPIFFQLLLQIWWKPLDDISCFKFPKQFPTKILKCKKKFQIYSIFIILIENQKQKNEIKCIARNYIVYKFSLQLFNIQIILVKINKPVKRIDLVDNSKWFKSNSQTLIFVWT